MAGKNHFRRQATIRPPWGAEAAENILRPMLKDGVLSDLVEVEKVSLQHPRIVDPWNHLPVKFWKSATFTKAFDVVLDNTVAGMSSSYNEVLSSSMSEGKGDSFCFVIGGLVRDALKGEIGNDVDFNYACSAQDVARVCMEHAWPLRYYPSAGATTPNKVIIGDALSDCFIEGFSITFQAIRECHLQDFRRNMLYYDLTNKVIIDKTGYGVNDILTGQLRISCAPSTDFDLWAGEGGHRADKMLRYVKFVVRAAVNNEHVVVDKDEAAFVTKTLTRDMRSDNVEALKEYWPRSLKQCMRSQTYLRALHKWVCEQNGPSWWQEWLPFVRPHVKDENWLYSLGADVQVRPDSHAGLIKKKLEMLHLLSDGCSCEKDMRSMFEGLGLELTDQDCELLFAPARDACPAGKINTALFVEQLCNSMSKACPL